MRGARSRVRRAVGGVEWQVADSPVGAEGAASADDLTTVTGTDQVHRGV